MSALKYLECALLMHDLSILNSDEWEKCVRSLVSIDA